MRYGIILLILMVSGCGQKGALYMPSDKPGKPVPAEASLSVEPVTASDSTKLRSSQ